MKVRRNGFTLIEIMVVITIIAAVLAIGAPRLFDKKTQIQAAVRKISTLTRQIRNSARIFNTTSRLVISFDEKKGHSFWVESAAGNVTLLSEDQEKEEARRNDAKSEKPKSVFSPDVRVLKKPEYLPKGLYFDRVEYATRDKPIESGVAYIHFFPQGLVEEVAIHISDHKTLHWTITVHPLTGRNQIFDGDIKLKEVSEQ